MQTITLTQGQQTLVDDDDFGWASQWKWNAAYCPKLNGFYAVRSITLVGGKRITCYLHRALMEHHGHQINRLKVDHRNHKTLDNQTANLRIATSSNNSANRKGPAIHNTSGYLGVSFHAPTNQWRAKIRIRGKQHHIGLYSTPLLAAKARDEYVIVNALGEFYPLSCLVESVV